MVEKAAKGTKANSDQQLAKATEGAKGPITLGHDHESKEIAQPTKTEVAVKLEALQKSVDALAHHLGQNIMNTHLLPKAQAVKDCLDKLALVLKGHI